MAALTIPEFSVGAGDLKGGKRHDKPIDPPAMAGQTGVKHGADAARNPLTGVRYGALLEITSTSARSAAPQRIADLAPAPRPATGTPAFANPASLDPLDAATAYAVVMLDRFAAPSGLPAEAPLASDAPTLHAAAAYAVLTLESFVAPRALAPELAPELAADPEPALMAVSELGGADEQIMQLAVPLDPAGLGSEAGLAPPHMVPGSASAPASAALPFAVSPPADLPPGALAPAAAEPATPPAALTALPTPSSVLPAPVSVLGSAAAPAPGIGTGGTAAPNITSQLVARVDGKAAGVVDSQQTATGVAVRLGSIAQVLSDRFDPAEIARIQASSASNAYLSLAQLQAHGIPVSYDPVDDHFNFGQTEAQPQAQGISHWDYASAPEHPDTARK